MGFTRACHSRSGGWRRAVCIVVVLSASLRVAGGLRSLARIQCPRHRAAGAGRQRRMVQVRRSNSSRATSAPTRRSPSWQGRHEFDGQMPDWSADRHQERNRAARTNDARKAWASRTAASMPEERFQRDYVVSRIDNDLFSLRDARQPFTNPAWYFDGALDPSPYVTMPYAPAEQRLRAFITYVKQVPKALEQIKANLQLPMPRTFIDFRRGELRRLRRVLSQRCAAGVRRSAGRGAEKGTDRGDRARRAGDGRIQQVAGIPARERERSICARRRSASPPCCE